MKHQLKNQHPIYVDVFENMLIETSSIVNMAILIPKYLSSERSVHSIIVFQFASLLVGFQECWFSVICLVNATNPDTLRYRD